MVTGLLNPGAFTTGVVVGVDISGTACYFHLMR